MWNKIEHDVVDIPAAVVGAGAGDFTSQQVSKQINSFDDKFVGRMVLMKSFQDKSKYVDANVVQGFGDYGSLTPHNESYNLRLNGANVFGENLSNPATKAMMLSDTWGKFNMPPSGFTEMVGLDKDGQAQVNLAGQVAKKDGNTRGRGIVGNAGFLGLSLNQKVGSLFLDYNRKGINNANTVGKPDQDPLDVHIYAECRKAISINSNGSFNVSYA